MIRDRLRNDSQPGERNDEHRLALAVEGGGMRGVISAGMLLALEQLGMRNCIDFVCGTSAGALASGFFIGEQATEGSVLFYTELNRAPFLDRRRLLRGGVAIDLDYLIGDAARRRGLDFGVLDHAAIPLYATVAPVEPDNPIRFFHVSGGSDRVQAILSATASLPVLAGDERTIDGAKYVDGGLHEQVPWLTAATLGATHILVLPTRPVRADTTLPGASFVERMAVGRLVRAKHGKHVAELVSDLPQRASWQAWSLRAVADGRSTPLTHQKTSWRGHLELVDLPDGIHLPSRLETERPVLVDALIAGAQAVVDHFALPAIEVEQRIVLTHPEGEVKEYRSEILSEIISRVEEEE